MSKWVKVIVFLMVISLAFCGCFSAGAEEMQTYLIPSANLRVDLPAAYQVKVRNPERMGDLLALEFSKSYLTVAVPGVEGREIRLRADTRQSGLATKVLEGYDFGYLEAHSEQVRENINANTAPAERELATLAVLEVFHGASSPFVYLRMDIDIKGEAVQAHYYCARIAGRLVEVELLIAADAFTPAAHEALIAVVNGIRSDFSSMQEVRVDELGMQLKVAAGISPQTRQDAGAVMKGAMEENNLYFFGTRSLPKLTLSLHKYDEVRPDWQEEIDGNERTLEIAKDLYLQFLNSQDEDSRFVDFAVYRASPYLWQVSERVDKREGKERGALVYKMAHEGRFYTVVAYTSGPISSEERLIVRDLVDSIRFDQP